MDELKNCPIKKLSKRQGLVRSGNSEIMKSLHGYLLTKGYVTYNSNKISQELFDSFMNNAEEKQVTKKTVVEYI